MLPEQLGNTAHCQGQFWGLNHLEREAVISIFLTTAMLFFKAMYSPHGKLGMKIDTIIWLTRIIKVHSLVSSRRILNRKSAAQIETIKVLSINFD